MYLSAFQSNDRAGRGIPGLMQKHGEYYPLCAVTEQYVERIPAKEQKYSSRLTIVGVLRGLFHSRVWKSRESWSPKSNQYREKHSSRLAGSASKCSLSWGGGIAPRSSKVRNRAGVVDCELQIGYMRRMTARG